MRALLLVAVALPLLFACTGPAQSGAASTTVPKTTSKVVVIKAPTIPREVRVGRTSQVSLTVRNDGTGPSKVIALWFRESFFDGFILRQASPAPVKDSRPVTGGRTFEWGALAPGEERTFTLDVTGNKPGEYDAAMTVFADGLFTSDAVRVGGYSGRSVVLP